MKKDNKTFLILSVFGILFVVFGHVPNSPNLLLDNLFPFYSFHMALFVFISGYFFKEQKLINYIKRKFIKLILPYFIYRILYGLIINILNYCNIIKYGGKLNFYNIFIAPFITHGNQFYFNTASWFLLTIFFIQVIYMIIYKLTKMLNFKLKNFLLKSNIFNAFLSIRALV